MLDRPDHNVGPSGRSGAIFGAQHMPLPFGGVWQVKSIWFLHVFWNIT
jgi:hypothetical protein